MVRSLLIAAILWLAPASSAGDWTLVSQRDGVTTWSTAVPGTKLLGFKGAGDVDVHISKMLGAMLDPKLTTQWVDLLVEQRVISDDGKRQIIYQRYDMAWPVADRDLVLERTVETHPVEGLTTVQLRSTTHALAPEVAGVVRADVDRTWLSFRVLPGGHTRVEVEAFTDPRGIVPSWLVNLVQKTWARNSITALTRLARKESAEPFEAVRHW